MTMITIDNYQAETEKIKFVDFPENLQKGHEYTSKYLHLYNDSDKVKEVIDLTIEKINKHLDQTKPPKAEKVKQKPESKKKEPRVKAPVKERKERPAKKVKATKENPVEVEKVSPEVAFIRRYLSMNGKVKTDNQVRALVTSIQKAITEKAITRKSSYASEIMEIQKDLIKVYNSMYSSIMVKISSDKVARLTPIAKGVTVLKPVLLIKRYLTLQGKPGVKEKAQKLLEDVKGYINSGRVMEGGNPIDKKIALIYKSLESYIANKTRVIELSESELQGLHGLIGFTTGRTKKKRERITVKPGKIISSADFCKVTFNLVGFKGKWKELIGDPSEPYRLMIYGEPGSGKSTLSIELAHYLAKNHNQKVLYISDEEKFGHTLQEKITRLNAAHKNLFIVDKVPGNLASYDVVFFDSVNSMKLQLEDLEDIADKYPGKSYVYVFQTTKDGKYRGSQEFPHFMDAVIEVANGKAKAGKNRFGGHAEIQIFSLPLV